MNSVRAVLMAVGMFTVIPVPRNSWRDDLAKAVMPVFPLVGLIIGAMWYALIYLLRLFSAPVMLSSFASAFFPMILTGFIHADGFMDTADAVMSRRNLDERRLILKDPHIGAFGVVSIVLLSLLMFSCANGIFSESGRNNSDLYFLLIPVVSRCVAAVALIWGKPFSPSGYAGIFKNGTKTGYTLIPLIALAAAIGASLLLGGSRDFIILFVELIAGITTIIYLYRSFKGISGDLCGCAIVVAECAAMLAAALVRI